jgi:Mg2+ and Co2+ transporter CorA
MLEGVKIVIERLQMDEVVDKWIFIAEGILEDPQKIFSEQEKNELRNIYRTAKRKQFNANIIDEIADRPTPTTNRLKKEARQLLDKEFDKQYKFMRKVNNHE